jgi:cardiolipin synthase (CMP-forming)
MFTEIMMITTATFFTIIRIILTPFIVHAMIKQSWQTAFFLFMIAALTDMLDGFCARLWNEKTVLGACLDPIADKILILSIFFTLAFVQSPLFSIPLWFVVLILIKELVLIIGVVILFLMKGRIDVKPSSLGKITTLVQLLFITWLFACYFCHWLPIKTYYTMLGALLIFSAATLVQYVLQGVSYFFFDVS